MAENGDKIGQQSDPREALQEVLRAIRRNAVRVGFTTAVFVLLGYGLTQVWPNKYESTTLFILRDWHIVDAALIDELSDISYTKKLQTLENELRSRKRIEAVMNELQWKEWLDTAGKESERRKLIRKFGENLTVDMEPQVTGETSLLIKFKWTTPLQSADFVNRLRDSWIQLTLEGDKKEKEENLDRQDAIVRGRADDYEHALQALRKYELENNVPSLLTPEANNNIKAELMIQKTTADADHESAVGAVARLQAELLLLPREIEAPPKPMSPEQIGALGRLAAAADGLKKMTELYKAAHPKRVAAQKDYDDAKAALEKLGGETEKPAPTLQTNPVYFAKAQELEAAKVKLSESTAFVNSLQRQLDDSQRNLNLLPEVAQEVDRLRSNITLTEQLHREARQGLQPVREQVTRLRAVNFGVDKTGAVATGTGPVEILETAVEADDPVLPISAIIMAVSLVVGLAFGALGPVLGEMTRGSFGTVKEVSRLLGVPVLGAVDMILTARDLRARAIQKTLTWATMALVLLSLATALYIWHNHPDVLPAALIRTLRDVRMALT